MTSYFLDKKTAASYSGSLRSQLCMYWDEDHYERADCNERIKGGMRLVAYDSVLVAGFRKITRRDTVTAYSIGKVWYLKRNKDFDLFTAPGVHPIHHDTLHPLTMRIINSMSKQEQEK